MSVCMCVWESKRVCEKECVWQRERQTDRWVRVGIDVLFMTHHLVSYSLHFENSVMPLWNDFCPLQKDENKKQQSKNSLNFGDAQLKCFAFVTLLLRPEVRTLCLARGHEEDEFFCFCSFLSSRWMVQVGSFLYVLWTKCPTSFFSTRIPSFPKASPATIELSWFFGQKSINRNMNGVLLLTLVPFIAVSAGCRWPQCGPCCRRVCFGVRTWESFNFVLFQYFMFWHQNRISLSKPTNEAVLAALHLCVPLLLVSWALVPQVTPSPYVSCSPGKHISLVLLFIFKKCFYLFAGDAHTAQSERVVQGTMLRRQTSPSTIWVLGWKQGSLPWQWTPLPTEAFQPPHLLLT